MKKDYEDMSIEELAEELDSVHWDAQQNTERASQVTAEEWEKVKETYSKESERLYQKEAEIRTVLEEKLDRVQRILDGELDDGSL